MRHAHTYMCLPHAQRSAYGQASCTYIYEYIHTCSPCTNLHEFKHMCSPGSYIQHKHATLAQVCAGHICALGQCPHLVFYTSFPVLGPGHYPFSLYLQGVDRSHSWVNSAYAPGGSKAVLRRVPPYCGADPRQVLSLPASTRVSPPLHAFFPPSRLQ